MGADRRLQPPVVIEKDFRSGRQRVSALWGIAGAVVLCGVLSGLVEFLDFDPSVGNRRFHVALEVADAVVLMVLAAVLLGRFQSDGSRRNLLLAAGVVVLAAKNGLFAGAAMFAEDTPGNDPVVWSTATSGVLGSALLAAAALFPDRKISNDIRRTVTVLIVGITTVALLLLVYSAVPDLPFAFPAVPPNADEIDELDPLSGHPAKIAIDLVTAAFYAFAAVAFARLADRHGDRLMAWLSVGATIAAGAFVYFALIPSRFTELIYGGEILWLCAVVVFLFGAISEITNLEAALVRSAVTAERRRVARDLHDGVVQELAYIASQAGWLLGRSRDTEWERPLERIGDAVERALDESRGAIAALNRELDEPLHQAIGNAAAAVAHRVGARLELDLDPLVDVPAEWRDALIRITREAVGNAVRHGGAQAVELQLTGNPAVCLRVRDDGVGFDPSAPRSAQSFGLRSMRERAESLGGVLTIESQERRGMSVQVLFPDLTKNGWPPSRSREHRPHIRVRRAGRSGEQLPPGLRPGSSVR